MTILDVYGGIRVLKIKNTEKVKITIISHKLFYLTCTIFYIFPFVLLEYAYFSILNSILCCSKCVG